MSKKSYVLVDFSFSFRFSIIKSMIITFPFLSLIVIASLHCLSSFTHSSSFQSCNIHYILICRNNNNNKQYIKKKKKNTKTVRGQPLRNNDIFFILFLLFSLVHAIKIILFWRGKKIFHPNMWQSEMHEMKHTQWHETNVVF